MDCYRIQLCLLRGFFCKAGEIGCGWCGKKYNTPYGMFSGMGDPFADILLQNMSPGEQIEFGKDCTGMRDQFMAENTLWILPQEEAHGKSCIFISGHNGHLAQFGSYDAGHKNTGNLLADALGEGYFSVGTDFYRTHCNLPAGHDGKRTNWVFYSHDPLENAAKQAGTDVCWLVFSKTPEDTELKSQVGGYTYMDPLGELYAFYMRLLPQSYRVFLSLSTIYDGIILVTNATPTTILPYEGDQS